MRFYGDGAHRRAQNVVIYGARAHRRAQNVAIYGARAHRRVQNVAIHGARAHRRAQNVALTPFLLQLFFSSTMSVRFATDRADVPAGEIVDISPPPEDSSDRPDNRAMVVQTARNELQICWLDESGAPTTAYDTALVTHRIWLLSGKFSNPELEQWVALSNDPRLKTIDALISVMDMAIPDDMKLLDDPDRDAAQAIIRDMPRGLRKNITENELNGINQVLDLWSEKQYRQAEMCLLTILSTGPSFSSAQ